MEQLREEAGVTEREGWRAGGEGGGGGDGCGDETALGRRMQSTAGKVAAVLLFSSRAFEVSAASATCTSCTDGTRGRLKSNTAADNKDLSVPISALWEKDVLSRVQQSGNVHKHSEEDTHTYAHKCVCV